MELKVNKKNSLQGEVNIPGDKSISHRAIIMSALADGNSCLENLLEAEDCLATLTAFAKMGIKYKKLAPGKYEINGQGLEGLQEPDDVIDCGNSGTGMRLLTGLLAGQRFNSVLTGDDSLRQRPMRRIIDPLQQMGAKILSRQGGLAPLTIEGAGLTGINYRLPVASAQVKSCLLLAGLYADGDVVITEPAVCRDHTERFFKFCGIDLRVEGSKMVLKDDEQDRVLPFNIKIPGDISSAAFLLAAGLLIPGSKVIVNNTGINNTRSGFLDVLKLMGADITLHHKGEQTLEPVAAIEAKHSHLKGVDIKGDIIPRLIDEIPILAVLATRARGKTVIRDAEELRVKESDRIKTTAAELRKMGADIEELNDGMIIRGPVELEGTEVDSHGDHRLAMALTVAGCLATKETIIKNFECTRTSFPDFYDRLNNLEEGNND